MKRRDVQVVTTMQQTEQDLATRYVLDVFHRLRTDEAVKGRYDQLLVAVNRLPNPVKMQVWETAGWCCHSLWLNDAPMPPELKGLLGLDESAFCSYHQFVFSD
jgi:hypothetical protein